MLRKIDRLLLRVTHLEAAARFYRDVLGLTVVRQDSRLVHLRLPDDSAEMILHNDPDLPEQAVYYLVESVRELFEQRATLGLNFVQSPAPVSRGYRAAIKDPFGNVLLLLDRTGDPDSKAGPDSSMTVTTEDGKAPLGLFAGVEQRVAPRWELLLRIYQSIARTADDLPYTPHFEKLYNEYTTGQNDPVPTRREVWRHLLNLRKGGKLPRLGEARSQPPPVSPEDRQALLKLVGPDLGKRDRLPYTPRFDELVDAFNKTQPRALSPHLVWRLIATLAK